MLKNNLVEAGFFFVVWQGIYDSGQTQEKDGERGFILLPSQPAVLTRSVEVRMLLNDIIDVTDPI